MHFLKNGQKNQAFVDPPPPLLIRAMPERKRFFSLMSSLNLNYPVACAFFNDNRKPFFLNLAIFLKGVHKVKHTNILGHLSEH